MSDLIERLRKVEEAARSSGRAAKLRDILKKDEAALAQLWTRGSKELWDQRAAAMQAEIPGVTGTGLRQAWWRLRRESGARPTGGQRPAAGVGGGLKLMRPQHETKG
jgi:hypothetical protein